MTYCFGVSFVFMTAPRMMLHWQVLWLYYIGSESVWWKDAPRENHESVLWKFLSFFILQVQKAVRSRRAAQSKSGKRTPFVFFRSFFSVFEYISHFFMLSIIFSKKIYIFINRHARSSCVIIFLTKRKWRKSQPQSGCVCFISCIFSMKGGV